MKHVLLLSLLGSLVSHGEVVVSEIMYHPASELTTEEYLELHNTGGSPVDVSNWSFTNGIQFTLPPSTSIPANGRLVVAANAAAFAAKHPGVTNVVAGWTGRLSNSSNNIVLNDAAGTKVDEVDYSDDGDWGVRRRDWWSDTGHKGLSWDSGADGKVDTPPFSNAPADVFVKDRSLELVNDAFDNSTGQNWHASLTAGGTPGQPNSVAAANIAPVIRDVAHFPPVPKSSDPVYVTARVVDDQNAAMTIGAFWRVDGTASFSYQAMADDGQHGDTLANDGIYGASLPVQPNGTIVEFYISASDGSLTRTWPAAVIGDDNALTPQLPAGCLYQVDNTAYAAAMPIYRLVMKAADKAELAGINANGATGTHPYAFYTGETNDQTLSHVRFNASFVSVDGAGTEIRYRVGVRNRGNGSRSKQPQGLNVAFPNDDPWNGKTQLNLNSQYTPYQVFGAILFAKAGVPAPESRAVQLRWNAVNPAAGGGSPSYGFYACNEAWNTDLTDHRFPTDSSGNLYRGVRHFEGTTAGGTSIPNAADFSLIVPGASETKTLVELHKLNYQKQTNTAEDAWSDLIGLTQALAKGHSGAQATAAVTWDDDYATAVKAVADVPEWMRWFAVNTVVDNSETNLSNGDGDDFNFYFGITDPHCKLMPYDLDTILNGGDTLGSSSASLFRMIARGSGAATPMNAFVKHPDFAPVYYAALKNLLDNTFKPANFNALAEQTLGGVVDQNTIDAMKTFNTARTTYIATQIPLALSVTTFPTVVSGYPKTTTATTTLGGQANAITTRSVKVNGVAAAWTAWSATWSAATVALKPGINRVLVQSFDASGIELDRLYKDVWYDDSSVQTVSGNITSNTTWTAAGGPWQVTASISVTSGATLTIEPGASVYLSNGATLTIASGGKLLAEGNDANRIRFGIAPGSGATWTGLVINGAAGTPESKISYARFENNTGTAIDVNAGDVTLDHLEFGNAGAQYVSLDGASFLITNCDFPTATAAFELMHGTLGVKTGGRGIVKHCWFGAANGYNDVIDFTGGQRPGPIFQVIDCVFSGSGDDILDLDGTDAWVEHNIFLHCHKNGAPDSSAAVSGGNNGSDTSQVTIVGNLFYDMDHAITAKQGNYYVISNNTVVHQTKSGGTDVEGAVLNLQDAIPAPPTTYGEGLYVDANIFNDCEQLVRNYAAASSTVTLNNNLMPFAWSGPGSGNTALEPLFQQVPAMADTNFTSWSAAQVMWQWLSLRNGSPAHGTGPNGRDKGGVFPIGVCISANVGAVTNQTSATFQIGPVPSAVPTWTAGYTHYRWRIDSGAWSGDIVISSPLSLSGLTNGNHTLEVSGKNDAGFLQDIPASFAWNINPAYTPPPAAPLVRINEVLAKNVETIGYSGTFPDLIELHNAGTATATLDGWGLTDDSSTPYKFAFPAGTTLAPGAYLVINASSAASVPSPKTGFGLKDQGDTLTLTRSVAAGGGVADVVAFGNQLPDFSIGRRASDGVWDLCRPSFGAANIVTTQSDPHNLRINEWLAANGALSTTDFIELYNPSPLPIAIGGGYLTDNPSAWPDRHAIRQLTYVGAGSYVVFKADGDTNQGPDHLSFKLSSSQGEVGLFASDLSWIDSIAYGPQTTDVSQGRSPNGGGTIAFFDQPTPGGPNPGTTSATSTSTVNIIPLSKTWKYMASATDYSATFYPVAFNDTSWPSGGQLLYYETGTITSPSGFTKTTQVPINGTIPYITTYFRTHFTWNGPMTGVALRATTMIDDGALIYLNGQEAARVRIANGAVTFGTFSGGAVGPNVEAAEESIVLPANLLVQGDNVLAVEVHQTNSTSTDVVWGMKLDADVTTTLPAAQMVINEVLVTNQSFPDAGNSLAPWVEIYNPTNATADLSDMSLSTVVTTPRMWVVPSGTTLAAGAHLVIRCDPGAATSASNSGLTLNPAGGGLFLFHAPAVGGGLRDSVNWGNQLPDYSIGRMPNGSGAFTLNLPTRGTLNDAAATGPSTGIKINEWLASPAAGSDWFELFNTGSLPVALGGNFLTDTLSNKTKQLVAPLTFIGGSGATRWLQYYADSSILPGHVNFALSGSGEALGLYAASGAQIDALSFGTQTTGVSEGRYPDGTSLISSMSPTPGAANVFTEPDTDGDGLPDSWETAHGFDPNLASDASLDADGDGMSNLREYIAGTDPRDGGSRFTTAVTLDSGTPAVRFIARAGHSYTVQYSNTLGSWTKLADVAAQPTTGEVGVADPSAAGVPDRFYRILTPAVP